MRRTRAGAPFFGCRVSDFVSSSGVAGRDDAKPLPSFYVEIEAVNAVSIK